MSATTPPRQPIPPVTGTCRWVSRRHHHLKINGTSYTVLRLDKRFRLVNWRSGSVYDVDTRTQACSCPSYVWFHCPVQAGGDGRCKHVAALRSLGLLVKPSDLTASA